MLTLRERTVNRQRPPHLFQYIGWRRFKRTGREKVSPGLPRYGIATSAARLINPLDEALREVEPRAFDAAAGFIGPDPTDRTLRSSRFLPGLKRLVISESDHCIFVRLTLDAQRIAMFARVRSRFSTALMFVKRFAQFNHFVQEEFQLLLGAHVVV